MSGSCWYQQGTLDKSFPDSLHDFIQRSDQEPRWQRNAYLKQWQCAQTLDLNLTNLKCMQSNKMT